MARDTAVKGGEELQSQEEDVRKHGIGHDLAKGLDGLLAWIELLTFRTISARMISRAGPPAKADARNRAAMTALSQK